MSLFSMIDQEMVHRTIFAFSLASLLVTTALGVASTRYSFCWIPQSLRFELNVMWGVAFLHWQKEPYRRIDEAAVEQILTSLNIDCPLEDLGPVRGIPGYAFPGIGSSRVEENFSFMITMPRCETRTNEIWFKIPLWVPWIFVFVCGWYAAFPLRRRHLRRVNGLCFRCGYDLRGTPRRCPECGTSDRFKQRC